MQETILNIVATANKYLSDYVLIIMLVVAGLFFSFKTKFVQVRCFKEGLSQVFGGVKIFGKKSSNGLTSFQAVATAIAAQVGTGNIVGASGAILLGGPGAIFWMWVIAFLGMSTIYAEAVLAQKTRIADDDGEIHGGPVYYIKKAFPGKFGTFLAYFFAIAIILALGFMGSMVQSNSIAETACNAFGADYTQWGWIVGIIIASISAFIFIGGVQRLASVTEKLVPFMALIFLVGGLVVLCFRIQYIPETIGMIFKFAFTPQALIGGGVGYALKTAISQGAKRGLFSNEAGMGSTPHAHAMANVERPHKQGVAAIVGVFIDTFVVLTMTALIVISSLYTGPNGLGHMQAADYLAATTGETAITIATGAQVLLSKTNAMQTAFANALSFQAFGNIFVAVCLFFFAFSTIIGWNFFGRINVQYLFKNKKIATKVYSIIAIIFVFTGTLASNDLVWELTDFFNYLMVIPNVIALIALGKLVTDEAKEGIALNKKSKKK